MFSDVEMGIPAHHPSSLLTCEFDCTQIQAII